MTRGPAAAAAAAVALLLGLGLRSILLLNREVFFDELATVWFARRPLADLPALLLADSASPLYLLLIRPVVAITSWDVEPLRWISVAFGLGAVALLAAAPSTRRTVAPLVLAILPAHGYFSTEARAYALVALLVGIGVVLLAGWDRDGGRPALAGGTAALLAAAYAHGYGALFLPLPALIGAWRRDRKALIAGVAATAVAAGAFVPGLLLAAAQPEGALAWMEPGSVGGRLARLAPMPAALGFAPSGPAGFLPQLPWFLAAAGALLVLIAAASAARGGREAVPYLLAIALPIAGVIAIALIWRLVYFPLRFESVLAVPVAALAGLGVARFRPAWRTAWIAAAILLAGMVWIRAVNAHASRPEWPVRAAARLLRATSPPERPVIASGYAYLEVLARHGGEWTPELHALPREQASHPGWYVPPSPESLSRDLDALAREIDGPFVWIGQIPSAEWAALRSAARIRTVSRKRGVAIAIGELAPVRTPDGSGEAPPSPPARR